MPQEEFHGKKHSEYSFSRRWEKKLIDLLTPLVPSWIETYHLTLFAFAWSTLAILSGCLAHTYSLSWLWLSTVCVCGHYITDILDGEVGRRRNTGLVRWGFYMDHFTDYLFLCSVIIGYSFLVPSQYNIYMLFALMVFGAYMVNCFLEFAATNKLNIAYFGIGPTEIRFLFIVINTALIVFGTSWIGKGVAVAAIGSTAILSLVVYKTQKKIWKLDKKYPYNSLVEFLFNIIMDKAAQFGMVDVKDVEIESEKSRKHK